MWLYKHFLLGYLVLSVILLLLLVVAFLSRDSYFGPRFFTGDLSDLNARMRDQVTSYIEKYELEIQYNKEICPLQLNKRSFRRLSSKFYYKSGQ